MRFPMLTSLPLLLAAGAAGQTPWWQQPVVLSPDTTVAISINQAIEYKRADGTPLRMDVYRPRRAGSELLPAVIFVHGGPIPQDLPVEARLIAQYTSLGALSSSRGIAAVTFSHRLVSGDAVDMAALDVRDAVAFVVAQAAMLGIDANRLCIWAVSAGGTVIASTLLEFRQRLRCLVLYYTLVDPAVFHELVSPNTRAQLVAPSLASLLGADGFAFPPTLIVRAGRDKAAINEGLDRLAHAAILRGADVELHAYAEGRHGFDVFDDTLRSRELVARTLDFLRSSTADP